MCGRPWSRRKYTTGAKDRIVGFVPIHADPVPSSRNTPVPNGKEEGNSSPQTRASVVTSIGIDGEGTRLWITAYLCRCAAGRVGDDIV